MEYGLAVTDSGGTWNLAVGEIESDGSEGGNDYQNYVAEFAEECEEVWFRGYNEVSGDFDFWRLGEEVAVRIGGPGKDAIKA
jgi:hypothetical protein